MILELQMEKKWKLKGWEQNSWAIKLQDILILVAEGEKQSAIPRAEATVKRSWR